MIIMTNNKKNNTNLFDPWRPHILCLLFHYSSLSNWTLVRLMMDTSLFDHLVIPQLRPECLADMVSTLGKDPSYYDDHHHHKHNKNNHHSLQVQQAKRQTDSSGIRGNQVNYGDESMDYSSDHQSDYPTSLGEICPPNVIQSIYASCKHLHLGFDVVHLSVELFELFIRRHIKDISEAKIKQNLPDECVLATKRNMKQQTWLRLLTCVLLAAKYQENSHTKIREIRQKMLLLLQRINPRISEKSLNRSEMRVLKVSRNDSYKRIDDLFILTFVHYFRP